MAWLRKNILIVLILHLPLGNVYCQNPIPTDHLTRNKEIILLNTDRRIYLTGDEIWFSLINVNAYSHEISVLSKIAYVELYNNKSIIIKKMIRLSDGSASGVIRIPPGLKTGYFILRAYTNWMKNFSNTHYANRIIPIINPLDKSLDNTFKSLNFRFYPEGGTLVSGIPNKIFYSVLSKNEIKSSSVLDNEDNQVHTFEMDNIDIGSFTFIPGNKKYRIVINDELDSTYVFFLPDAHHEQNHISIHQGLSVMEINVSLPSASNANLLEIVKFDSVFFSLELNNNERKQIISIDNTYIPYGTSIVHLKDPTGEVYCARPIINKGNSEGMFKGITDRSLYNTREKVELTLNSDDFDSWTNISVRKKTEESSMQKIELIPLICSRQSYFNNWYGSSFNQMQLEAYIVLNTESWKSKHYRESLKSFNNPPEYNGHIIKGRVIPGEEDSERFHEVFLSVEGDPYRFYTSTISPDNGFYFSVFDLPVSNSIILSNSKVDFRETIETTVYDPFDEDTHNDSLPSLFLTKELFSYLEQMSLNNQLKFAFSIDNKNVQGHSLSNSSVNNLPKPNSIYLLDNYTRFQVMEEVIREIVRNVHVRINKGNYSLKVLNPENGEIYDKNPLILLDGLPIFNINRFMEINPILIESIEVVNSKSFIGQSVFDGVIFLNSYKRDYADYEIDSNYYVLKYYNIDEDVAYQTPDYFTDELKNSRIPDFRNSLYWHPNIQINPEISEKIEFYTSDDEGTYEIQITGINKDGSIISINSDFEVVKSD